MTTTDHVEHRGATVRLELSPLTVSIAVARSVVRRIVTFRDDEAESSFLVALTEIMANAVDEHQRIGSSTPIVVEVDERSEVVRIADAGAGIRPGDVEVSVVPDAAIERGRGLSIARAFVFDLSIDSTPSGTTVALPLNGFGIVR